jgi:molybdenum cofactor cytidylyltransferase
MSIDCLILAAGAATRFGSCKMIADYKGHPLIAHAIHAANALEPERIIIVTGASHERLDAYRAALKNPSFELAYFDGWQSGMGYSLAFGTCQLDNDNPVLILLGDQPEVSVGDLRNLYRLWQTNPMQIVCAGFAGTLGVPAIFPAAFKHQLRRCTGDRGAKQLLFNYAEQVLAMNMPAAEFDVDTPADLCREFAAL